MSRMRSRQLPKPEVVEHASSRPLAGGGRRQLRMPRCQGVRNLEVLTLTARSPRPSLWSIRVAPHCDRGRCPGGNGGHDSGLCESGSAGPRDGRPVPCMDSDCATVTQAAAVGLVSGRVLHPPSTQCLAWRKPSGHLRTSSVVRERASVELGDSLPRSVRQFRGRAGRHTCDGAGSIITRKSCTRWRLEALGTHWRAVDTHDELSQFAQRAGCFA